MADTRTEKDTTTASAHYELQLAWLQSVQPVTPWGSSSSLTPFGLLRMGGTIKHTQLHP